MMQAIILLTGALAIWLVNDPDIRIRRLGAVIGLCGQPFWLWSTWQVGQWGMFALSLFYTVAWVRGLLVLRFDESSVGGVDCENR